MEYPLSPPSVFGTLQKFLFILCGGGWGISLGIQVSIGIMLNELIKDWGLSFIESGIISTFSMIGLFIGFSFWGTIADKYGRMHAFKKTLIFIFSGLIFTAFSPEIWSLSMSCLLTAFGMGGSYAVDGTVFLEYCPENKQYLLAGLEFMSSLGSTFPPCLAWIYSIYRIKSMWRVLLISLAVLAFILLLPRFKINETPGFMLLQQERRKNACENSSGSEGYINLAAMQLQDTKSVISRNSDQMKIHKGSVKEQVLMLFRKPLRFYTFLYIAIWGGTGFTFAGLSTFLPILLKRSGIGTSDESIYQLMLYQQLAGLPGVILAVNLVKTRLGRKKTLIISLILAALSLFGFIIVDYIIVMIFSMLYYFFQSMYLSVVYCITPETYPVEVRNTASGVFGCANCITSIIAPLIAAWVLTITDDNLLFILFFSISLVLSATCSFWIIETKGFDPKSFRLISNT